MTDAEFCEELRQRALRVLDKARGKLLLHPENAQGRMAPHVALANIREAARICQSLEALGAAGDVKC